MNRAKLRKVLASEGLTRPQKEAAYSSGLMDIDKKLRKALPSVIGPAHKLTMKDRKVDKAIRDLVLAIDDVSTPK